MYKLFNYPTSFYLWMESIRQKSNVSLAVNKGWFPNSGYTTNLERQTSPLAVRNLQIKSGSRDMEQLTYFLWKISIKMLNFLYNITIFLNIESLIKTVLKNAEFKNIHPSQKYLLK